MIDLFYSTLSSGGLKDFYNSLNRGLRRRSNPSILLFPEYSLNLYLYGSYPISRILEGIPTLNEPETSIFFNFHEPRGDDPKYAAVKGCVVNNQGHTIIPRYIDIGGPGLKYEGHTFSYLEDSPPQKEYEIERGYPLFTIDGRKVEFRICWDVWAKTKNRPDLIFISAFGLQHRRREHISGKEHTLETVSCPVVINDGRSELTIYTDRKRYDGDQTIEIGRHLGLNIQNMDTKNEPALKK